MTSAPKLAQKALDILARDAGRMEKIERYFRGHHDDPYMPENADDEYRLLAKRCITNWCELLVNTPAQALYVDNFRRGDASPLDAVEDGPEWLSWQRSRLDGRQSAVYIDALKFGHSFVLTKVDANGDVITKGLSALRTVTLYADPTDLDPQGAAYVQEWAHDSEDGIGTIIVWDTYREYVLTYRKGEMPKVLGGSLAHGLDGQCPVTRFAAYVDLEGRTWGVIEPMIPVQDRINQTVMDLLIAQTYTAWEVRTVTGMAPPMKMMYNEDTGLMEPVLDSDGHPVPDRVTLNATRFMYAESPDAKFSTLPGGKLDGFIAAAELAIRHLSALSQTPPHFLLGQIANISADALEAAETALSRKVGTFRTAFGESWERVFRLTSELLSNGGDDFSGEVIWRDLGASSMAQSADALGKLGDQLEIPKQGLWPMIPGVKRAQLAEWKRLADEQNTELQVMERALGPLQQAARPTSFAQEAMTSDQSAA